DGEILGRAPPRALRLRMARSLKENWSPRRARTRHDFGSESFHPIQALGEALTPEVEDQLAHPELRVDRDVLHHPVRGAREWPQIRSRAAHGPLRVVDRRLEGDGEG